MHINFNEQQLIDYDIQAEINPGMALDLIRNIRTDDLSARDKNRLLFMEAKALSSMRQYQSAMDMALECLNLAILEKDYYLLVKCNILQDYCYSSLNKDVYSRPYLEIAMEYAVQSGDLTLSVTARTHYLMFLRTTQQFMPAQEEARKILDLVKRIPVSYYTTNALSQVATLYLDMTKRDMAIKYLQQALLNAKLINLPTMQLNLINNLGAAYTAMNDLNKAEEFLLSGLKLAQELAHQKQIILFHFGLGNIQVKAMKYKEAIEYFDTCIDLLSRLEAQPPMLLMDLYNNFSMCYWFLGQKDTSLSYIDRSIALARENGFVREEIQISVNKTNLLIDTGAFEEAGQILQRAAKYYKQTKDKHQLIWVNRSLARFHAEQSDYKKAYEIDRKLDAITDDYISEIMVKQTDKETGGLSAGDLPALPYLTGTSAHAGDDPAMQFIGRSKAWQNVLNSALLAAQHQKTSVMIIGESGTGKEVIAHIIHKNSLRRHAAFVPVNVGAISASLIESELFGHTRGAFTGAHAPTKGFFLQADKGTLFLDEITEMPYEQQSKLLRALESRKIIPVGSSKEIPYDSRIITATNQNLRECLSANKFRLDLYHRLNTIEIVIPPLRERPEDIEPIFLHYVDHYARELNKTKPFIEQSLFQMLYQYSFPGNARELKNMVERLFILSNQLQWDAELLCRISPVSFHSEKVSDQSENADEASLIIQALIKAKGKQKDAAKLLNMSEATLYRRIVRYKLQTHTRKGN